MELAVLTVPLLYSGRHDPTGNAYGTAVFYVGQGTGRTG